ncbi:FAD-binding oxidoreductase, partial [Rhodoferax sp. 4810]|nr:FAD-binding oxidoreductase [Rhodoferax jenense]
MINVEYQNYVKTLSTLIPEKRIFTDTLRRLAYGTDGGFYRLEPQVVV